MVTLLTSIVLFYGGAMIAEYYATVYQLRSIKEKTNLDVYKVFHIEAFLTFLSNLVVGGSLLYLFFIHTMPLWLMIISVIATFVARNIVSALVSNVYLKHAYRKIELQHRKDALGGGTNA